MVSGGVTHTAIVPLDLIKCRIQVNPQKYEGIIRGFKTTISEEGLRALGKGWAPTAIGYSLQGLGKYGLYEIFKDAYTNLLGKVGLALSSLSTLLCPAPYPFASSFRSGPTSGEPQST
jgi:solute carrier family 25 phosphate transporter 3